MKIIKNFYTGPLMGKQLEFQAIRLWIITNLQVKLKKFLLKSKFQTFSQLCASSGFLQ